MHVTFNLKTTRFNAKNGKNAGKYAKLVHPTVV